MPETKTSRSAAAAKPGTGTRKKRRRKRRNRIPLVLLGLFGLLILLLILFRMAFLRGEAARNAAQAPEPSPSPSYILPPSELSADCFGWDGSYKSYDSPTMTARLGVDVSLFQGGIDWDQVAQSGVDFAIIRAGYRGYGDGSTVPDDLFTQNVEAATANGIGVGVYFFSQALNEEEARAEAHEVLAMLDGYEIQYPIYFDWEPIAEEQEARTASISATELTACAKAFCDTIEAAGYRAGIYFNLSMASHYYHIEQLGAYSFWLAEYQDVPSFPFAVELWQYSNEGQVPGIYTTVDMNLCFVKK